ncbi:MAG: class I SAM-dependent methyltransferase [Desulfosarcina sp.]|nr:class I SAM-dependent methyltransferase [Desulfobacterales bacterium]
MPIDAEKFDRIARTVLRPVYPVIADQIIKRTGITRGAGLDIGCGNGYLGMALMALTDLSVSFLDPSRAMLDIAQGHTSAQGFSPRTTIVQGDVNDIPLPDNAFQLAVSRGSIFFWQNLSTALQEILRVLSPAGMAYIGGGFGTAALKEEISRKMEARDHGTSRWKNKVRRMGTDMRLAFEQALKRAGIVNYDIVHNDEVGLWIVMTK